MNNMPNMTQELNKGMIQVHMDQPPRYITKLAWQDIHEGSNMLTREDTMELDKNDMDQQNVITTRGQP
jgi:hypothetical protein